MESKEKKKQRRMTNGECIEYIAQKSNLDFPRGDERDDLIDDKLYGCFIQLDAELKELEEYRKIMGTPIQDIMKRLKVLEILKEICLEGKDKYGKGTWGWVEFDLGYENGWDIEESEKMEKVREWLKNEESNG